MSNKLPVRFDKRADKELKKLKRTDKVLFNKLLEAIESIRIDPSIGDPKREDLAGISCVDVKHYRINYEIAYRIELDEHNNVVVVIMVGTRENFYSELKRYLK